MGREPTVMEMRVALEVQKFDGFGYTDINEYLPFVRATFRAIGKATPEMVRAGRGWREWDANDDAMSRAFQAMISAASPPIEEDNS